MVILDIRREIFLFILIIFNIYNCISQTSDFCYSEDIKSKTNIRLYLVGENHIPKDGKKIYIAYHKFLLRNKIIPKYIVAEYESSFAYTMNKYLKTGDENCLNLLSDYTDANKQLLIDYRIFYQTLPEEQKFETIGVDIERFYSSTEFAIGDILITNYLKTGLQEDSTLYQFHDLTELIRSFKDDYVRQYISDKYLASDLDNVLLYMESPDSLYLKAFLKESKSEFYNIMASYKLSKNRNTAFYAFATNRFMVVREEYMANQIYSIFERDSNAIAMGVFGSDHVLHEDYKKTNRPQDKIRIGNILQANPKYTLLNHQINSSVIYYSSFKKKYYTRFLKTDLSMIPGLFKEMENCRFMFKNINSKGADNLILFRQD